MSFCSDVKNYFDCIDEMLTSDEVGLGFLIFFWKIRKKKNPANPVDPVQKFF